MQLVALYTLFKLKVANYLTPFIANTQMANNYSKEVFLQSEHAIAFGYFQQCSNMKIIVAWPLLLENKVIYGIFVINATLLMLTSVLKIHK